jgi:hypothetical protein
MQNIGNIKTRSKEGTATSNGKRSAIRSNNIKGKKSIDQREESIRVRRHQKKAP